MKKVEKYSKQYLQQEIREIENSGRKNELLSISIYEKAIIYKYSEDGYEDINENLRKSKGKNLSEFGEYLEASLSKLTNFKGIVYRGVNLDKKELKKYIESNNKNISITEPAFISTTKSIVIASQFRGNSIFKIISKSGKAIEKIAKFGFYSSQNEKEVLFSPNTKFKLVDITNEVDYMLITMEEI